MCKYFYYVARFIRNGVMGVVNGMQKTDEGYFDVVSATENIAKEKNVDVWNVIITFWAETNSVMYGKFNTLKERIDG